MSILDNVYKGLSISAPKYILYIKKEGNEMKNYLTYKGILVVALICFIAGAGFIGSIWVFKAAYDENRNNMILEGFQRGNIKPEKDGAIVKFENENYAIINNEIYKIDK